MQVSHLRYRQALERAELDAVELGQDLPRSISRGLVRALAALISPLELVAVLFAVLLVRSVVRALDELGPLAVQEVRSAFAEKEDTLQYLSSFHTH